MQVHISIFTTIATSLAIWLANLRSVDKSPGTDRDADVNVSRNAIFSSRSTSSSEKKNPLSLTLILW